jgi:TRAP transporter TAXI family solute receptor
MKKSLIVVALTVIAAVMFCACTPAPAPAPDTDATPGQTTEQPPAPPSVVRLTMATGGTSGTYYPYGGALALAIDAATSYIKINVNSTGASAENVQQIGAGLAHLAIVQNDVMDYAYNGTNTWTAEPVTGMATLMSLYPEVCQLIVSADSGIESVNDLKGKRISTGDIGSGVEANAIQILEAYGLTVDDLKAQHLGFGPSADAMKDKTLDGFFATSGVPNTAVLELSTSRDIRVINIDDTKINDLIAKYPFYAKVEITNSDYSFLPASINTVAVQATLITSPDLDDQVAYDIVKAIIESKESIMVAHAKGAFIDATYAVKGVSVDFHPGAKKYFQEIGVL